MGGHILEKIVSFCSSITHRGREARLDATEGEPHLTCVHSMPRSSSATGQVKIRASCSYILFEAVDKESFVIRESEGLALSIGPLGMLLLMNDQPQIRQIIEVRMSGPVLGSTMALLEVCWTRRILSEGEGERHVVEGKFLFGPYSIAEHRLIQPAALN